MKTVVLSTMSYAVFKVVPSILLTLALFSSPIRQSRPDVMGDFLVAGYLMGISSGLSVVGFLAATAWSASWRGLPAMRASIIAGALGLVSPVVSLFVGAASSVVLLPLLRQGHWIGMALFYGLGGVVLGGVAVIVAKRWPGDHGEARKRPAGRAGDFETRDLS